MRRSTSWATRVATTAAGAALVAWAVLADPRWAERHVLPSYCATHPAEWVVARAGRWLVGALGVVVAVKLAPALERRAGRSSLRPQAGSLVGIALAVVASLGVAEVSMRRLHQRLPAGEGAPLHGRGAPMARADARLGWSWFPGRTTWIRMGDGLVAYAIDAEGDRAASEHDLPDHALPTVLFTGESIAFGYGLAYEETIPFLVGRDLGVQTVNVAVIGYGSDQAHLRALDALARYRHPLAVVTLFITDQIDRNVDAWRPRLALGPGGTLQLAAPSTGLRIAKLLQELPYRGDERLRVTAAVLRATAEAARARGALPLFVVTNHGAACLPEGREEAWVVDELFVRQRLPFLRVELGPEDRLPLLFERHPSARGAHKIAAAVERALSEQLGGRPSR
ncbi:MAG TPA: hypothetical protein VF904_11905 [Anaeromyxobacteraceae bacterium]